MASTPPRTEPLHIRLDHPDPCEIDRVLASTADAIAAGAAPVLILDAGTGEGPEAASRALVLGDWHRRHATTLREGVDAAAYVATGIIGYAYMLMFCYSIVIAGEFAVFHSRKRAIAWARSKAERLDQPGEIPTA